jgi:quinol monooxygenase YgiN
LSEKNLYIVAKFTAKPGLEEVVNKELASLLEPTRAEAGCISYDCHRSQDDPAVFVFYEVWKNREELDKHLGTPYLKALLGKVDELFSVPPELHFLNKLD